MATTSLVRGKTLPDSGVKADLHELIDLSTVSISEIVNADINASAAIAGSKISPNFGAQSIISGDITTGAGTFTGAVDAQSTLDVTGETTMANVTIDGVVTAFGTWVGGAGVRDDNTAYLAETDGFFTCYITIGNNSGAEVIAQTDSTVGNPTTVRAAAGTARADSSVSQLAYNDKGGFCIPVKKGDYYRGVKSTTGTATVTYYWLPIG
jgi:hypothetical protein